MLRWKRADHRACRYSPLDRGVSPDRDGGGDREIKLKRRRRGLAASEMAESLLALWAAGGERAEDLDPAGV
jgi:hypothetical protein